MKFYTPEAYTHIDTKKLRLVQLEEEIVDAKFENKPVGFFKDAAIRFCRNKSSIMAVIGILIITFFAIWGPDMNEHGYNDQDPAAINLPAKIPALSKFGIFEGGRWLSNRRVDTLTNTEKYPEGCILDTRNHSTLKGVEVCDVLVDYYVYKDIENVCENVIIIPQLFLNVVFCAVCHRYAPTSSFF